ncbi:ATP phosphoribosyltransferase [Candidatus Pacearchaeota archaeon]|nr:ATP phosphoribosyltransferase [Candidatus Pacearchaeota archaeon]
MDKIKLGLPAGSLQNSTLEIFKKAGFTILNGDRSYFPIIDDDEIECMLIRAQEIPKYVEEEVLDVGLTGKDWIVESGAKVIEIDELVYSKQGMRPVKLVIAVPKDSKIKSIKDLEGKRIATELVGITKNYLKEKRVNADVEFSWGATEAKTPKLADAIVELTETGRSLSANNLRILEVIMESTIRVIVNKKSFDDKRKQQKIRDMVVLLKGALMAEGKVGLKLNIREEKLDEVIEILSALRKPTVSPLSETGWLALEVVIEEKHVRNIIPKLKSFGAEGIVEYPLNKVIY